MKRRPPPASGATGSPAGTRRPDSVAVEPRAEEAARRLETRAVAGLVAAGALLRLLLCWWTPPSVSFDDHYQPIHLMLQGGGVLPRKDACSDRKSTRLNSSH